MSEMNKINDKTINLLQETGVEMLKRLNERAKDDTASTGEFKVIVELMKMHNVLLVKEEVKEKTESLRDKVLKGTRKFNSEDNIITPKFGGGAGE